MVAVLSYKRCTICRDYMQIAYKFNDGTVIIVCGRCDRAL